MNLVLTQKRPMICGKDHMSKHSQSIDKQVRSRIFGHKRGWVFTPRHFQDLGGTRAIEVALRRLKAENTIRQLARGIYDYPRQHPALGTLSPTVEIVAKALSSRDAIKLQPSGGYAANLLGLSEQVPMKVFFLTDGPSRTVALGKQTIVLKQTTPKNMATAGRASGLVIQALRHIGRRNVNDAVIVGLRKKFSPADKRQLLKDLHYAPAWVAAAMRRIAEPAKH